MIFNSRTKIIDLAEAIQAYRLKNKGEIPEFIILNENNFEDFKFDVFYSMTLPQVNKISKYCGARIIKSKDVKNNEIIMC